VRRHYVKLRRTDNDQSLAPSPPYMGQGKWLTQLESSSTIVVSATITTLTEQRATSTLT